MSADPLEFLGEEFLTWLWHQTETSGGDFELPGNREVGVSLDDFIAFAPRDDDETEHTLKKGSPSRGDQPSDHAVHSVAHQSARRTTSKTRRICQKRFVPCFMTQNLTNHRLSLQRGNWGKSGGILKISELVSGVGEVPGRICGIQFLWGSLAR